MVRGHFVLSYLFILFVKKFSNKHVKHCSYIESNSSKQFKETRNVFYKKRLIISKGT